VKILGLVVHSETADQTEVWQGQRVMSLHSRTTTNGRRVDVLGEARPDGFRVTTPLGTAMAPADVEPTDPRTLNHLGHAVLVSIETGEIEPVEVTGGGEEPVMRNGVSEPAQHFHVRTSSQPNRWEVWIDRHGVPVKFSSREHYATVEFTLVSSPRPVADIQD
jgi:hypothetical protein